MMKYFSSYFFSDSSPFDESWDSHDGPSLWESWKENKIEDSCENSHYPYHAYTRRKKSTRDKRLATKTSKSEDWYITDGLESSYDVVENDFSENGDDELAKRTWKSELCLTMKDKEELLTDKMLSDKHMYAAQKLLARQFPFMLGFQDTCLAQTRFKKLDNLKEGASVQIHHVRGNHWMLSASIASDIYVYDSIFNDLTPDAIKQLKVIYTELEDNGCKLHIIVPDVKTQTGSKDCGLFVIAYAVDICNGYNPSTFQYDQAKMRQHFKNCLERDKLTRFPITSLRVNEDFDPDCDFKVVTL